MNRKYIMVFYNNKSCFGSDAAVFVLWLYFMTNHMKVSRPKVGNYINNRNSYLNDSSNELTQLHAKFLFIL